MDLKFTNNGLAEEIDALNRLGEVVFVSKAADVSRRFTKKYLFVDRFLSKSHFRIPDYRKKSVSGRPCVTLPGWLTLPTA